MTVCTHCHGTHYVAGIPCAFCNFGGGLSPRVPDVETMGEHPPVISPTHYVIAGPGFIDSAGCVPSADAAWAAMWSLALAAGDGTGDGR